MKPPRLRITIRRTVVATLVLATLLTALAAISLQYYFGRNLIATATEDVYTANARSITSELQRTGVHNGILLHLLAEQTSLVQHVGAPARLQTLAHLMEGNPLLYGIHIGHFDGSFYEIINLEANPAVWHNLQVEPGDRWVAISIDMPIPGSPRERRYDYLDADFGLLRSRVETTDFDVTTRPWFTRAVAAEGIHRSEPYPFDHVATAGRTLSMHVPGTESVIAIDLTLDNVTQFLTELDISGHSEVFIYNRVGEVLASSEASTQERRVSIEQLLDIVNNPLRRGRMIEVQYRGESYYAFGMPLALEGQPELFVGILSLRENLVGPLLEKLKLSLIVASLVLLLVLPLSWFISKPIVGPIKQLARENEKLQRRQISHVQRVPSHIAEVNELSESLVNLVNAIVDHEKSQQELIDSFIRLIAQAIDDKSPHTGGHCNRVPELAIMMAEAASDSDDPAFTDFKLVSDEEWREYRTAAWLHDCGKITTPEHVVDKGTKLETIYNRIHEIRTRFEVLWRDAEIDYYKALLETPDARASLQNELKKVRRQLHEDFAFIAACNVGGESLDPAARQRLDTLAQVRWTRYFDDTLGLSSSEEHQRLSEPRPSLPATETLLADKPRHRVRRRQGQSLTGEYGIDMKVPELEYNLGERYNLQISRGTLNNEERFIINSHMISTIKMLESLPFPDELRNVPRWASTHHETLNGRGYPRRLTGEALSIPERILAIADIFEALTAADRPYKAAKSIDEAIAILAQRVDTGDLDRDCFRLFLSSGIYLRYAERFLAPGQVVPVDVSAYL